MKCYPFKSKYLKDFQVVEERKGNVSIFPHTDQLPKLHKAINSEFRAGLPDRIARVDHRGTDYMKLLKVFAVKIFCDIINKARQDNLKLLLLPDRDLVARVAIVQQLIEHHPLGPVHRFKFYAGDDLFVNILLNGRTVAFAGHVMDRFSERVPNYIGEDLGNFLEMFYTYPPVAMECNGTISFVNPYRNSIVALPIRPSADEYFLPTCLSAVEISRMFRVKPPPVFNFHYDTNLKEPETRNFNILELEQGLLKSWDNREPMESALRGLVDKPWSNIGHAIKDTARLAGRTEGSRCEFVDNILGPAVYYLLPGMERESCTVLNLLRKSEPDVDWDDAYVRARAEHPNLYNWKCENK